MKRKNKFDIVLNWLILLGIIYLLASGLISLFEPVFYGENTVGKNDPTEEELINAMAATYNYFDLYKEKKYDGIEEALSYTISEDNEVYKEYYKYVSLWKDDELEINEVKKKGSNKFVVNYSIKTDKDAKLIIKLDDNNKTYKIFYDSILERY